MTFLVMSFYLINAPTTFIDLINRVFRPYLHLVVIVFIDDILIYLMNEKYYDIQLRIVFKTLKKRSYLPCFQNISFCSSLRHSFATYFLAIEL